MVDDITLDATDWRILAVLQRDGRRGFTDLARDVAMSASAVTERVRRLERAGVIRGYAAVVDPSAVGLPITALVRLRYPHPDYRAFHDMVEVTPQVVEAHHVTGEDCFVVKVLAESMPDLEAIVARLAALGPVTTNVVYSSPLPRRPVLRG
ncbi:Lrp/AsnC family leucine-responsive transcriptional regulator [Stackebrandtia albiflava]|uniref:Lrp/AsnC family leucine-responsive transcriptional regulator n=1 Tax=Stackebrandtia albiflava TaxID=406432 RepID=A0A562VDD4_9ACTN|nr:Lrp/AsnC family transcriptional regulator [Stackebrandtia albiflava]TWJ15893.1 Lrp/AsnC family leucine-responsive transcriptional regulator [Stackebrandtia albiflava]